MAESTASARPLSDSLSTTPAASAAPVSSDSAPSAGGIAALASAGQFLKPSSPRKRRRSPEVLAAGDGQRSPSPVSPKTTSHPSPFQITGASEMAAQKRMRIENEKEQSRQTSENPQKKALGNLMGALNAGMSKPQDAPSSTATNTLSEPLAAVAPMITIPDKGEGSGSQQASPTSMASLSTMESAGTTTVTATAAQVASPGQMGDDEPSNQGARDDGAARGNAEASNKSFTYPGPLLSAQLGDGRRGMSLPGAGSQREDSRSPSTNKKHKCPYCSTEFTRHHNLKSHLLTHSHEKPYVCQTCDSRFRRLHDLKRHTKLHTGERPHVCPKCNRSFARGDALARHNKGQGGCAGRRSSAGSFGGDGEDGMEGMIYTTGDASQEPDAMDDDGDPHDERGSHLPSIRRHEAPGSHHLQPESQGAYQRQPSTYPPVAVRAPMNNNLYPPPGSHGGSGGPTSPNTTNPHMSFVAPPPYTNNAGYGQPITESPKPLSPGHPHPHSAGGPRNRSPSLTTGMANQPYGRRQNSRASPPVTLPPPHAPTLPPPHGLSNLNPVDGRFAQPTSPAGSMSHGGSLPHPQPQGGSYPGPSSAAGSNSLSSHGTGGHHSGERAAMPFSNDDRIWAYIKSLEQKVDGLQAEVTSLRAQIQQQPSPTSQNQPPTAH